MGNELHKVSYGFLIEKWDSKTKEFLGQEFVTNDNGPFSSVEYEDELGNTLDEELFYGLINPIEQ